MAAALAAGNGLKETTVSLSCGADKTFGEHFGQKVAEAPVETKSALALV